MLLYTLYRIVQVLMLILPLKFSYWLGARIADIHYYTSKKDRNLVVNNLKKVFGKDDKKTRYFARLVLRNFAKYLVEFLRFEKMGKEYIQKHVKIEGIDNIKRALAMKKGAILFSAHLGNWEWGAAVIAQLGFPISVITLAHKDRNINKFFIKQRNIKGVKNIPLGGSVRESLRLLARNELIGILSDRDFSNNSIPVDFFGEPAYMPVGIGILAVKSGASLLPVFIVREKGTKYRYVIESPFYYDQTKSKQEEIKNIVQKAAKINEKYVRLYPEQWFMFHDLWKAQQ